jgi:hypothetical protein
VQAWYVKSALKTKSLPELVSAANLLGSETKTLDTSMQNLVYENYNKFISATDTIRQMKESVGSMDTRMQTLVRSMEEMTESSAVINGGLQVGQRAPLCQAPRPPPPPTIIPLTPTSTVSLHRLPPPSPFTHALVCLCALQCRLWSAPWVCMQHPAHATCNPVRAYFSHLAASGALLRLRSTMWL